MDERIDLFLRDQCVLRGASLQQAAKVLNVEMFDLAVTILKNGRYVVGDFWAVPSEERLHQSGTASSSAV